MAAAGAAGSKFKTFLNSPAGPKTVFFWAPLFKWWISLTGLHMHELNLSTLLYRCLVAAGVSDLKRPADKVSIPQNMALTATGFIWVRYSFVIYPVNYSLAAVNAFVGATGLYSLQKGLRWRQTVPGKPTTYYMGITN